MLKDELPPQVKLPGSGNDGSRERVNARMVFNRSAAVGESLSWSRNSL